MKTCIKCNIEQPLDSYSLAKGNKDGVDNTCKTCKCKYGETHRNINKTTISEQRQLFRENNKERLSKPETYIIQNSKVCTICNTEKLINEFNKRKTTKDGYRFDCKTCQSNKQKEYRKNNPESNKSYQKLNKDILNIKKNNKKKTDIQFKISCNLRTRLWGAIKNDFKSGSAVADLGCTISEFKVYIEEQFKDGMTWENWGVDTWHLDHKIPLANFDLADRVQLLKAVHYSNMQPLFAIDNLEKGARF